ncbi:MAG TPA: ABC transporter permease subunit [Candidatus Dormibacteraeota bacterium]|nr:ABC transporter permease subunit [Candidatus Dormibacteraeota bacterium]
MSWLYALRLGRWGVAGFSTLAFAFTLLNTIGFYRVAGHTPAERAAFARSITVLAGQFTVLLAPPLRPDTVGGYIQFRVYGALAIMVAVWALAAAAGAVRGDEEKGLVEGVLATGVSRADAIAARFLAFAAGAIVMTSAAAFGFVLGVDRSQDSIDAAGVFGATVVLVGLALCCYSLTLLVCQFASARFATAAAGIALLVLFLTNSLSRTIDALKAWRWLSPFHYYEQSRPLAPGGMFDVRATEVLFGIAVVAAVAAAVAFTFRDIGSPLVRLPVRARRPSRDPSAVAFWRVPVLRGLYDRRFGLLVWMAGFAVLAALFVVLTKEIVKPLLDLAALQPLFNSIIKGDIYPSFLNFIWFGFGQLLIAGYAITQVGRWAAEDGDGRLELTLAQPVSRGAVVVERAVVLAAGTLAIAAAGAVAVAVQAQREGIGLNSGRLLVASLLFVPFAAFLGAFGSLLAARIPRATVGVLGGFAFVSYFITQLAPVFAWPAWVQDASPFHLYGQPLSSGVDGTGLTIMIVVALLAFAASALLLGRRDVGA